MCTRSANATHFPFCSEACRRLNAIQGEQSKAEPVDGEYKRGAVHVPIGDGCYMTQNLQNNN